MTATWGYDAKGKPLKTHSKKPIAVVNGKEVFAFNEAGKPICGRKKVGRDEVCKQWKGLCDNGRCASPTHGGTAKGRPITNGRFIREKLHDRLGIGDKMAAIQADAELLSHRRNVELFEGMIQSLGESVGPGLPIWEEALKLYAQATTGEPDLSALAALGELLREGNKNAAMLNRLEELLEQQRKHIESETKRLEKLDTMIDARTLQVFVGGVATIVEEEVIDPNVRRQIGMRIARLMRGSAREQALPSGTSAESGEPQPHYIR